MGNEYSARKSHEYNHPRRPSGVIYSQTFDEEDLGEPNLEFKMPAHNIHIMSDDVIPSAC